MRMVMSPLPKIRSQKHHDENGDTKDGDEPSLENLTIRTFMVRMEMNPLSKFRSQWF
jgi:hypothetical protein